MLGKKVGFLTDKITKRKKNDWFIVALTRARVTTIIFGNPIFYFYRSKMKSIETLL